jgi:L-ribulose-5-phosphate 4-epimerase
MLCEALRGEVCKMNLELLRWGLVTWTSGNVSGRDPQTGNIVIKPSGVPYEELTPDNMVVVDLDGGVVEGPLRPSVRHWRRSAYPFAVRDQLCGAG